MDSRESVSSKTYSAKAMLLFICVALMVTLGSTSVWAIQPIFYSPGQDELYEQIYKPCQDRAAAAGRAAGASRYDFNYAKESQVFVECFDRHLDLTGVLFAVLVADGKTFSAGYSWNYKSLTAAYNRARRECAGHNCFLKAFAIDGCIAYARGPGPGGSGYGYHGYGVGATAAEARHAVLHGKYVQNCGERCRVEQVYCTGS